MDRKEYLEVGITSVHIESAFAMGKDAFLEAHAHLHNAKEIWDKLAALKKKDK